MSMHYEHLLIPERSDYKPGPREIVNFFRKLVDLEMAPLDVSVEVITEAERVKWVDGRQEFDPVPRGPNRGPVTRSLPRRFGRDPVTGDPCFVARLDTTEVERFAGLLCELEGLDRYDAQLSGKGPPPVPLLDLELRYLPYEFDVCCGVRSTTVSPATVNERLLGVFCQSTMDERDRMPKGWHASFWIAFRFSKSIFPKKYSDDVDASELLSPLVAGAAGDAFGVAFAQMCDVI
jgi:hypothetical protein